MAHAGKGYTTKGLDFGPAQGCREELERQLEELIGLEVSVLRSSRAWGNEVNLYVSAGGVRPVQLGRFPLPMTEESWTKAAEAACRELQIGDVVRRRELEPQEQQLEPQQQERATPTPPDSGGVERRRRTRPSYAGLRARHELRERHEIEPRRGEFDALGEELQGHIEHAGEQYRSLIWGRR